MFINYKNSTPPELLKLSEWDKMFCEYFCWLHDTDTEIFFLNATTSFIKAFQKNIWDEDIKNNNIKYRTIKTQAYNKKRQKKIVDYINYLLQNHYDNNRIDAEIWKIIKKTKNEDTKIKALHEMNLIRQRIQKTMQFTQNNIENKVIVLPSREISWYIEDNSDNSIYENKKNGLL